MLRIDRRAKFQSGREEKRSHPKFSQRRNAARRRIQGSRSSFSRRQVGQPATEETSFHGHMFRGKVILLARTLLKGTPYPWKWVTFQGVRVVIVSTLGDVSVASGREDWIYF